MQNVGLADKIDGGAERTSGVPKAYAGGLDSTPLFNMTVTARPSKVNHSWDLPPPRYMNIMFPAPRYRYYFER